MQLVLVEHGRRAALEIAPERPTSAMMRVRSNCPVSFALIRKYVDSSMGSDPFGNVNKGPSLKTAESVRRKVVRVRDD